MSCFSSFRGGEVGLSRPIEERTSRSHENQAVRDNIMIDLHCHLLWGVDDGPRTLDQSLQMLELAAAKGTTDIVATPHLNRKFSCSPEVLLERMEELRHRSGGAVRIHRGCDFHLTYDNVYEASRNHGWYTINGGRFLMAEIPDLTNAAAATPVLRSLIDSGITPIITHPERHDLLRRDPRRIRGWIGEGCLLQVTAGSLTGRFGRDAKKNGWYLVEHGLAHFIASDAHDTRDRTPRLDEAFNLVVNRLGSDRAHDLFVSNPTYVLHNEPLPYEQITPLERRRRWYLPWWNSSF